MEPARSTIRKKIFRLLAGLNKVVLPRYSKRQLTRLSWFDKLVIAYRYFITRNSLD